MSDNQSSEAHPLEWRGGVPVSARFDDPFYSLEDGLSESRHVFLGGNDLPARFADGFHIGELGFGTGLNFVAAALAWRAAGVDGTLRFTSFEAYPMAPRDAADALAQFPEAEPFAPMILSALGGSGPVDNLGITLSIVFGDARDTLSCWEGKADAWFLDGFAPARNPELWEPDLLRSVARHTVPEGTCATYSAAGSVRRALAEAGFIVERVPGYGRKRHMTAGRLK
ncbi:tRNA (5-methylaminomethyl-2-thiouridine)(34)-methyltransferase MnmD [Roseibacterium sp. SDUM158016]|uniref:tRNA (5-methylaminomethyl-2-thiouridine)(34)-methyltransferase MnmD n=1 Tax=Roseicyclus sediminis TaxID=2980997 RepID=UPI0021D0D605|nr:tRNA (5-methylaminomethyl-2-thiouridine)(34)-methyltransferase MnmD [Roseibacterium sp. SDUM158016]MCU4651626.1 tRNA (5-methylaminomethyl-2-thiouridine)(34)-methyltransferase MnmD [Roseibacterium sp. SDUM158016]